jgi:LPXTG-motif cell wall-anchored protein
MAGFRLALLMSDDLGGSLNMKDRSGAKKLYKTHRGWIAAGVAALTLFSTQALADQNVQAATADTTATTDTPKDTDAADTAADATNTAAQQQLETAIQKIIAAADAGETTDYASAKAAMDAVTAAQQQISAAQSNGASLDAVPADLTAAMNAATTKLAELQATVNAGPQTDTTGTDATDTDTGKTNTDNTANAGSGSNTDATNTDAGKTGTDIGNTDTKTDTTDADKAADTEDTTAGQTQLNAAAQAMVAAVNNADLTTAAGYQAASDAVKAQEQALKDAQDAGGQMSALPADLQSQLTAALKTLSDAQAAAQTNLNQAAQTVVDAVNNADLTTTDGFKAASDVATAQEQAMSDAVAGGAAMSAIPEALHNDLSAALAKLAAVQQKDMPQTKLDAAAQRVVDTVNAVDPNNVDSITAAKAAVAQQELAVAEALKDGALMARIPLDLQTDLTAALNKLADYLRVPEAQARLATIVNGIIATVGNIDATDPAAITQGIADYTTEKDQLDNTLLYGALIDQLPENLQVNLKDAQDKIAAYQKAASLDDQAALQQQLNDVAQAYVDKTNEVNAIGDDFDANQWQTERAALNDQLFGLIDAGASALDIPSDLQMALNKAWQVGLLKVNHQNTDTGQMFGKPLYYVGVQGQTINFTPMSYVMYEDGYKLLSLLSPQEWTLTNDLKEIAWLYQATPQDVTIHYVDAATNATLKADDTLTAVAKTGETIDLGTQGLETTIAGYTLQGGLNASYEIKGDGNDITLLYQGNPQTVSVHYQDAQGNELQAATALEAITGETVDLTKQSLPTTIPGYTLGSALNPAYVVKNGGNDLSLLYIVAPQALTISYKDANTGEEIKPAKTLNNVGVTGETIDLTTLDLDTDVDGYRLQNDLDPAYKLLASDNGITLLYVGKLRDLTISFQDAVTGKELKPATMFRDIARTGTTLDLNTLGLDTTVAGYTLQSALNPAYKLRPSNNNNGVTLLYLPSPQDVKIRYIDALTEKDIKPATILPNVGVTGDTIDLTKFHLETAITGYTMQSTVDSAYTLRTDHNGVSLLYFADQQDMKILYMDVLTGKPMKPATILKNIVVVGDTVDLTKKVSDTTIPGYTLQNNLSRTYTVLASDNFFMLNYLADQQDMTIRYVDAATGKELKPATSLKRVGMTGYTVNLTRKVANTEIAGYTLQNALDPAYKILASNNVFTLLYQANSQDMTIRYIDALTDKDIKPATVLSNVGVTGETIDLNQFGLDTAIDGYTMQGTLDSAYTLHADHNGVSLLYLADPQDMTIRYLDAMTGEDLKPATILQNVGVIGDTVDLTKKGLDTTVAGYTMQSTPNPAYKVIASHNGVSLLYLADAQPITVHFQDEAGNPLKADQTVTGQVTGETVDLTQKGIDTAITGYTRQNDLDTAYVVKATGNDVTLIYAPDDQTVTVHYKDAKTGAELKTPTTLTDVAKTGDTLDLTKQGIDSAIAGYTLQNTLNPAYLVQAGTNDFDLLYQADSQKLIVHSVLAGTKTKLIADQTIDPIGATGDVVDLSKAGIRTFVPGYTLKTPLDTAYVVTAGDNEIWVEYVKKDLPNTGNGGGTTTNPGGGTTTNPGSNGNNGGGTTTNPGGTGNNGGGTTTNPGGTGNNGGGTTTNPGGNGNNGGGTTTNPGGNGNNGGGTTTTPGDTGNNGGGTTTNPTNGNHGGTTTPSTGTATGTTNQPTVTPVSHAKLPDTGAATTTAAAAKTPVKQASAASLPQTGDDANSAAAIAGIGVIGAMLALVGIDIKKRRA